MRGNGGCAGAPKPIDAWTVRPIQHPIHRPEHPRIWRSISHSTEVTSPRSEGGRRKWEVLSRKSKAKPATSGEAEACRATGVCSGHGPEQPRDATPEGLR